MSHRNGGRDGGGEGVIAIGGVMEGGGPES